MTTRALPTERDALAIAAGATGVEATHAERFATGCGSFVYDVALADGRRVVVRVAPPRTPDVAAAAVHLSRALRPLGVPLPRLIAHRIDPAGVSWLVLERLSGTDLGHVYATLSAAQKHQLAADVVRVRRIVESLPHGRGFGFAPRPDAWPHATWVGVIRELLSRARARIIRVRVVDPSHADRVEARLPEFGSYFARVRPVPFLDDTTTRNVLVHDGRLSGIVDVDCLCYGDPLLTPALTRMSLLAAGHDTVYVDRWLELVGATEEQRRAVRLYTAAYAVDFLGEFGQRFNRAAPVPVDPDQVARVEFVLDELLAEL